MKLPPADPHALPRLLQEAFALQDAGRLADARRAGKRILNRWPNEPNALYLLGVLAHREGDQDKAAGFFRKSYKADNRNVAALTGLGIARLDAKRFAEALELFQKALILQPNDANLLNNIALARKGLGDTAEAIAGFRQALAVAPNSVVALHNLGEILASTGQNDAACELLDAALALAPDDPDILVQRGGVARVMAGAAAARPYFDHALSCDPAHSDANLNLASILIEDGDMDGAENLLRSVLAGNRTHLAALLDLSDLLHARGGESRDAAREMARRGIRVAEGMPPRMLNANKSILHRLGTACERLGKYPQAFRHYKRAHDGWRANLLATGGGYDRAWIEDQFDRIMAAFTARDDDRPRSDHAGHRPVFIVGMPRSGTTLMEQILASHPAVHGGGELNFMPEIAGSLAEKTGNWAEGLMTLATPQLAALSAQYDTAIAALSPDASRVSDKLPANFINVGLIRTLFPNATILHIRRNPLDTCLSVYIQKFGSQMRFDHDLRDIAHYYQQYHRLMTFWRGWDAAMADVDYEALVADQEAESRRLLALVGLEWDPVVLDFHKTARTVRTASRLQVRQPLYKQSVAKWRRFEAELQPLIDDLGPLAEPWTGREDTGQEHTGRDEPQNTG